MMAIKNVRVRVRVPSSPPLFIPTQSFRLKTLRSILFKYFERITISGLIIIQTRIASWIGMFVGLSKKTLNDIQSSEILREFSSNGLPRAQKIPKLSQPPDAIEDDAGITNPNTKTLIKLTATNFDIRSLSRIYYFSEFFSFSSFQIQKRSKTISGGLIKKRINKSWNKYAIGSDSP